jgi:putative NADH-flavin reductase
MMLSPIPAQRSAAVTPGTQIPSWQGSRALYVGGAGSLVVDQGDGVLVTFAGVPAGAVIDIRVKLVDATSTATNIVALY